jgi:hypothetical protein
MVATVQVTTGEPTVSLRSDRSGGPQLWTFGPQLGMREQCCKLLLLCRHMPV